MDESLRHFRLFLDEGALASPPVGAEDLGARRGMRIGCLCCIAMTELARERWPVLAVQIETALRVADEPALAGLLHDLRIVQRCTCEDDFCQSFYTEPPPKTAYGTGQRNVALDAPWPGYLILDVVDDRIMYVEVLHRPPLD